MKILNISQLKFKIISFNENLKYRPINIQRIYINGKTTFQQPIIIHIVLETTSTILFVTMLLV